MQVLPSRLQAPADACVTEHRSEKRHLTVLMVGKVKDSRGEFACVVNDVSSGGLRARFPRPVRTGERLMFELRGVPPMNATVRWVDGCQAGVQFDEAIDLDLVAGHPTTLTPRAPRFMCNRPATLIVGGRHLLADVLDLSLGGAKLGVIGGRPIVSGGAATLVLPVLNEPRAGTVKWDDGTHLGFQFAVPLTINGLSTVTASR